MFSLVDIFDDHIFVTSSSEFDEFEYLYWEVWHELPVDATGERDAF
jgi:hypothetical protein